MKIPFKRIFCKHEYKSLYWFQEIKHGNRYSIHKIQCVKCGKERFVDGDTWHFEIKNKYY